MVVAESRGNNADSAFFCSWNPDSIASGCLESTRTGLESKAAKVAYASEQMAVSGC